LGRLLSKSSQPARVSPQKINREGAERQKSAKSAAESKDLGFSIGVFGVGFLNKKWVNLFYTCFLSEVEGRCLYVYI